MEVISKYLGLGFAHVLPYGYDHVLFIVCISLLCDNFRVLVIQCSVFTLAHSISLALAATNLISVSSQWIEPLIAISILYAALENIIVEKSSKQRLFVIFLFGLVHGLGFAGALRDAGIPSDNFIVALVGFNVGVELGQILVVAILYVSLLYWFCDKEWYRKKLAFPLSSVIACIALYWTVKRLAIN